MADGNEVTGEPLFQEEQRFRQWWVFAVSLPPVAIAWWTFVQQIVLGDPFGTNPASDPWVWVLFAIVGLALPWLLSSLRLRTEVRPGQLTVAFRPFSSRNLDPNALLDVQAIETQPLRDWGGYGYRRKLNGDIAYLVRGRDAVRLSSAEGRQILIGSQRPGDLVGAIQRARGSAT